MFMLSAPLLALLAAPLAAGLRAPLAQARNTIELRNDRDLYYYADLTVAGEVVRDVLVDTGSADTWVEASAVIAGAQDTGVWAEIPYRGGSAAGPIHRADIALGGHVVSGQAFIQVAPDDNALGGGGVLGLAPSALSDVHTLLNGSAGATALLDTLFAQATGLPPYATVALARARSHTPSTLTIGTPPPGVLRAPRLPLEPPTPDLGQQWAVLLEADAPFRVDGQPVPVPASAVPHASAPGRLTALLDTGFSLNQVPRPVADALYARVPGAHYAAGSGVWLVPCTTEIHVEVALGGRTYAAHPLDSVLDVGAGGGLCAGAWQPLAFDGAGCADVVLGQAFLRSAAVLFAFGDAPHVRVRSTAPSRAQMHAEFVRERMPGASAPWGWRATVASVGQGVFAVFASGAGWFR